MRFFAGLPLALLAAACAVARDPSAVSDDEIDAMMLPGVDESAMDRAVDPCADFYAFSCNGFDRSLPVDTVSESRGFSELRRRYDALFTSVVEAAAAAPRTEAEKKASSFLESCKTTNDLAHAQPYIQSYLATFPEEPTKKDLAVLLGTVHGNMGAAFFSLFGSADRIHVGRVGALSAQPAGYDWSTDYHVDEQRNARLSRVKSNLASVATKAADDAELQRQAEVVVGIEAELAEAALGFDFNAVHPLGKQGLELAAPSFDWEAFFTAMGAPKELGAFNIPALEYFTAFDGVFTSRSPADILAYIRARAIEDLLPPTTPEARDDSCKMLPGVFFSSAYEARFLEAAGVDDASRARARALFERIVVAFDRELQATTFLDSATRIEARVKLQKMKGAIGATPEPDDFADLDIDPAQPFAENMRRFRARHTRQAFAAIGKSLPILDILGSPATVNAFYDDTLNRITIPGGIMGGYFFSPNASDLAITAGLGTVIGHEITHGFDVTGRLSDGDGVIRNWWSPATTAEYNDRAQGLADQYAAFSPDGVVDEQGQPVHIDGVQTLPENIADNGGIKIAYLAANVEGRGGRTASGFTPAQQFFVGFAQLWCGKMDNASALKQVRFDTHSPRKARVNLPLQNFDKFSEAFACGAGAPMAPEPRNGVW